MTDESTAALVQRLREAHAKATRERLFVFYSQDKQAWTIQIPQGWLFVASDKGTEADARAIVALHNALPDLLVRLERAEEHGTETCEWFADADGNYTTDCDNAFTLIDATPVENGMAFCCYCGKKLVEVTVDAEDGDD